MKLFQQIFILTLVLTFAAFSQESETASSHEHEISLNAGFAFPYLPGDFSEQVDIGHHFGGGLGMVMQPGTTGFSAIYLSFGNDRFKLNENEFLRKNLVSGSGWAVDDGTTNIYTLQLEYKGTFSATRTMLAPFFIIGVGAERFIQNNATVTDGITTIEIGGTTSTTFTWNIGAGIDMPISKSVTLFHEFRYLIGVGEESKFQHVTTGSGLRFRF